MTRDLIRALCLSGAIVSSTPGLSAAADVLRIGDLNTRQIQALDRSKTVVFLIGGMLEEHGPYLPANTDGILSEKLTEVLTRDLLAKHPEFTALVFPTVPLGSSGSNEIGGRFFVHEGTYAVRPRTLRAIFMDLATELGEQGFKTLMIVHVHGAPLHNRALDEASDFFRDTYGGNMVHLWGLVPVLSGWGNALGSLPAAEKKEDGVSLHAGLDETSLMLHLRKDLVAPDYKEAPAVSGSTLLESFALPENPAWRGYWGSPRLGSAELGRKIWDGFSAAASLHMLKIVEGADPRQYVRYADLLEKNPLYKTWFESSEQRDEALGARQQKWLDARRKTP